MIQVLAATKVCTLGADIDPIIPSFISAVIKVFQIAIPIVLVALGMIDLGKAVTSNDEKQMKEAQKTLIKRVIYAILIFFIIAIVKFVFGLLSTSSDGDAESVSNCIDCFINYDENNCQFTTIGNQKKKKS